MNVELREWYLDAVLVQSLIDSFEYYAVVGELREYVDPYDNLEQQCRVGKLFQHHLHSTTAVDIVKLADCIDNHLAYLLDV